MRFVRHFPTRLKTALAGTLFAVVSLSGCGTRTVLVPPGEPVRLRETVKGVKVWAAGKNGKPVPGKADLPEGWYALPDPGQ